MKKIILFLILGCAITAEAQYGYRNNNQRRRQNQAIQPSQKTAKSDFPIKKYLGIVVYDVEKTAKKSSIKLSSKEGKEFSKVITKYNKDIKDITRINSFLIKSTKDLVDQFQDRSRETGDYSNQQKIQLKMAENLKPISETLKEEDTKLDKTIKELLSEKQYKKWIKYNKKLYKVFPKKK